MLTDCNQYKVLFLMAADAEYGEHLQTLFEPVFIGIGPVEAAIKTTMVLSELKQKNCLPDLVVSLGSAGSAKLEQTNIYQVSSVSWRDMDATPFGVEKGVTPFLGLPAVLDVPCLFPDLPQATLSTGADIVTGAAYDAIDADMVDMETYAVMRACQTFAVPLIGLRGISDGNEELRHVGDWEQYLHIIDIKLAEVVSSVKKMLGSFPVNHQTT